MNVLGWSIGLEGLDESFENGITMMMGSYGTKTLGAVVVKNRVVA